MRTLIFDIWGDFGHFKKFYTTSSPLTFSFPPPPTILGMVAAIVGLDKEEYLGVMNRANFKVAVRILEPVQKIRMGLNHINTKGNLWIPIKKKNHDPRTQIRTEFLKNPCYRIYATSGDKELYEQLKEFLVDHKTYFTLSLGLSELLANYCFVGEAEISEVEGGKREREILSVVPLSNFKKKEIYMESNKKYFKERIPIAMTRDRIVTKYEDIVFEAGGQGIKGCLRKFWVDEKGEAVYFF